MSKVIDDKLYSLSKSKFRSSFKLNKKMIQYVDDVGIDKVKEHAYNIITDRLKTLKPNDGRQTPMKQVHPVFIAEHATGCCCRGCLEKIHNIPKNKELSDLEVNYIVEVIMKWIERDCRSGNNR